MRKLFTKGSRIEKYLYFSLFSSYLIQGYVCFYPMIVYAFQENHYHLT